MSNPSLSSDAPPAATPGAPRLRPCVVAAKAALGDIRERLRRQHDAGSPGIQVCTLFCNHLDLIVLGLFRQALADLQRDGLKELDGRVALVAHGGFGRRDTAPYSDVDIMLLHDYVPRPQISALAQRLTADICDTNLQLGFSVRTPEEACSLAWDDVKILTSLIESRLLEGSESLFQRYFTAFRNQARSGVDSLLGPVERARRDERGQYGETVYLLEPNLKRSSGGLRDLQLLRWAGFLRHGTAEPDELARAGHLPKRDQQQLLAATAFLLRLRNELHFQAHKANDVLDRAEQVRVAERFGYAGRGAMLPVEAFMREYFEHTSTVRSIVSHFARSCQPKAWWSFVEPLFSHLFEGDFRIGPTHISATSSGLPKVTGDVGQVLRLMDLSNLVDRRIDDDTWHAIRLSLAEGQPGEVGPEAYDRFLSILAQPPRLGDILRRLHALRVLERLVPGMAHARCLLQFNQYHQYTVDEHCLRAVECATDFFKHPGPVGQAYRALKRKRTLHLALLLHDLGKGFEEDHSEVGARLAEEAARRFNLPQRESEKLRFLVHRHLLMIQLAFQRDTSDEQAIVKFAVECGTPDVLNMLFVMSCADMSAVGPGVFNQWKLQVLTDLYHRTMYYLAGDASSPASNERMQARRGRLKELLCGEPPDPWFARQVEALPRVYLLGAPPEQLAAELAKLRQLGPRDASAWGRYLPERQAVEYSIATHEALTPGIFHKVTGALTSARLQILSAEIHTLADGLVWDRFYVQDGDFAGAPPAERIDAIAAKMVAALQDNSGKPPSFPRLFQARPTAAQAALPRLETRVRVDNSTSDRYTEFAVFTYDRLGLLYAIARALFELDLSVWVAKIGTHVDQVVDVFYVTDRSGAKITDERRIERIRERLLEAIQTVDAGS